MPSITSTRLPKTLLHAVVVFLLIFSLQITLFIPVALYAQQNIEETIMLEKARAAIVFVVTIPHAYVIWEEAAQLFYEVGLAQPVYVETAMFGTGFFVSPDGYIITNGHVVNEFESDLEEKLPLLLNLINTYAEAYVKRYGQYPSNEFLNQLFQAAVSAYLTNKLKMQDYTVDVYVGVGKVATGLGNIQKYYPARIVEATPFEKEDLALLKIEVKHAPSLIVSNKDTVNIGETVWVLGYPGAVTFHQLLSKSTMLVPTITRGMVSGYREKTTGITVLQSDVNVNHGNSGGPMIDSNGEVVAVTSFGSMDPTGSGREVPGFNFFIPATYVRELLSRNNVENTQDPIMDVYEEALRLYYNKHYSAAIEKFNLVKNVNPGFPYIDDYIADAQAAILRGEDVPLSTGPDYTLVLGLAVAGVGIAGVFFFLKRRNIVRIPSLKRKPLYRREYPVHPYEEIEEKPEYHEYDLRRTHVEEPVTPQQKQPVPPVSKEPIEHYPQQSTGVKAKEYEEVEEQQESIGEEAIQFKYCWNCGRKIPADAIICPYCGVKQEVEE